MKILKSRNIGTESSTGLLKFEFLEDGEKSWREGMRWKYFSFRLRLLVTGTWVKICYKILKSHWTESSTRLSFRLKFESLEDGEKL